MAQTAEKQVNRRGAILLITIIASFLIPFMSSSLNIALPAIGEKLNLNVITQSWVSTTYMLGSASLLIPFGRLADMFGRRKVFLAGNIIFTIGSFLSVISRTAFGLLTSRVIQGIGGAAIFSTAIAILTSVYLPQERGRVLGINTATVYLGLSLGPVVGGFITGFFGWKSIFILCSGASLIVILLIFWKIKVEFETDKEKLDIIGTIIYSAILIILTYGLSELPSPLGLTLIGSAIIGAFVFFWWETKTESPLINLNIFRKNRVFTFSNIAALVNYSGTWAVSFLISFYLHYIKGFSEEHAGLVLVTNPAVQALFSPLFGQLSDRFEPRVLASSGMGITTIGIIMLMFLTNNTSIVYLVGALILLGFGFALFSSPNTNAIMSSVEQKSYGFASATLATMRQMGMTLSMGIVTVVFALVIGKVEIEPKYYEAFITSMHIIFLIMALCCASAIFASLARGNIHKKSEGVKIPS